MAATQSLTFRYETPPAEVLALLLDSDFVAERSRAMGEVDIQVTARRTGDQVTIVNARNVKRELPSFARKLFSPTNHVTQTESWQVGGEVSTGSFEIAVKGAPVTVRARFELRPDGGGSEFKISYDVTVRVPLIGGKLETYTLEQTIAGARKELEYNAERLRGRGAAS